MRTSRIPLHAALAAAATFSGCATAPVLLPPESELRDHFGKIAVVALTDSHRIRYQVPDSKAEIAAERESFEVVTPCMVAQKEAEIFGPAILVEPRAPWAWAAGAVAYTSPAVIMGGAPLWQELRRAYGLTIADSAAEIAAARFTMDAAVAGVRFERLLRDRLVADLNQKAPAAAVVSSLRDTDTVLELMVYEPNISSSSGEGINPGLALHLGLRVRLLDARFGRELYYDYLDYRGPKHTFVNWAADDAHVFHAELERSLAHLSAEVVAQFFTRPTEQPASRTALAALGIERRPPSPVLPSGGSLWSPPYNTRGLARN